MNSKQALFSSVYTSAINCLRKQVCLARRECITFAHFHIFFILLLYESFSHKDAIHLRDVSSYSFVFVFLFFVFCLFFVCLFVFVYNSSYMVQGIQ